ncbi:hypothetical protein NUM3379_06440 [Kineococcus sp. NUM-3379]
MRTLVLSSGSLGTAAGPFLLLGTWNGAHDSRSERMRDEDQRIDALDA